MTKKKTTTETTETGDSLTVPALVNGKAKETKGDKFVRLVNHRMPRVIKALRSIKNLTVASNYTWTPQQAQRIVESLGSELQAIANGFSGNQSTEQTFSL